VIIAVVGGEGTGKTSLSQALGEALGLPVLDPLKARLLAGAGYATLFEWDAATRGLPGLVEAQAEREAGLAGAVVDGGVVDLYCLVQRWAWHRLSPTRAERLRETAARAAARYDRALIMPPRVVAGPAPDRFRSAEHNAQLTRLAAAFAREAALAHRHIDDGSPAARLAQALGAER
jgi:hypothetical protein